MIGSNDLDDEETADLASSPRTAGSPRRGARSAAISSGTGSASACSRASHSSTGCASSSSAAPGSTTASSRDCSRSAGTRRRATSATRSPRRPGLLELRPCRPGTSSSSAVDPRARARCVHRGPARRRHAGGRPRPAAARPRGLDRARARSARRLAAPARAGARRRGGRHLRRGGRLDHLGRLHLPAREPALVRAPCHGIVYLAGASLAVWAAPRRSGSSARPRGVLAGGLAGSPCCRARTSAERSAPFSRSSCSAAAPRRCTPASSSSSPGSSSTAPRSAPGSGRRSPARRAAGESAERRRLRLRLVRHRRARRRAVAHSLGSENPIGLSALPDAA